MVKTLNKSFEDPAQKLYKNSSAGVRSRKEVHPYSFWAFYLAIFPFIGAFLALIPFINVIYWASLIPTTIASIIFATLSFSKINEDERFYGKGFSIIALIIIFFEIIGLITMFTFFALLMV